MSEEPSVGDPVLSSPSGGIAIFSLFAFIVPHVSVEVGWFIHSLRESSYWKVDGRFEEGYSAVRQAGFESIFLFLCIVILTAAGIAYPTQGMDPNMLDIIAGVADFMSAIVFLILSNKAPKWLGLYHSDRHDRHVPVGKSQRVLKFHVRCALFRVFGCVYFPLLPLLCGANAVQLSVSIICGIVCGFVLDGLIYLGRRSHSATTAFFQLFFMTGLSISSGAFFTSGVAWVDSVWTPPADDEEIDNYRYFMRNAGSLASWLLMSWFVHMVQWSRTRMTLKKLEKGGRMPERVEGLTKQRMFASMYFSQRKHFRAEKLDLTEQVDVMDAIQEEESSGSKSELISDEKDVKEQPEQIQSADDNEEEEEEEERLTVLFRRKMCYCCRRDPDAPPTSLLQKLISFLQWSSWILVNVFFLYFVIVNIGAQIQVRSTEAKLPAVQDALYNGQNEGAVCAFDNNLPDPDIRTFVNKEAAHAEGYLVLHCGACAHCSDWHNLEKEWSTRNYLAAESARCARKSLTGGMDAVNDCLMEEPIGFRGECARCWTTDIACTKKNCVFIFFQSQIINKVGNFNVAPGQITSATCEEAHCEVGSEPDQKFVECSGANRRRMGIKSTIPRPVEQQCTIVDVDWEELFGDCCVIEDFDCPFGERCVENQ